ncbi:hypothetical protein AAMO2058_000339600 [Amorphochlora amoebiformis]
MGSLSLVHFQLLASCILFTGIVFGWSSIQLLLKEEGQYEELCASSTSGKASPSNPDVMCEARVAQFAVIFEGATMMVSIVALPAGMLLDAYGTRMTLMVAGIFEIAGCSLMAFADSKTFDVFLIAFCALGVGGAFTMFAAFSGAENISDGVQWAYIGACSCLFDASVIVFQVFYGLNVLFGVSRHTLFIAYAIISLLMYASMVFQISSPKRESEVLFENDYYHSARGTRVQTESNEISLGSKEDNPYDTYGSMDDQKQDTVRYFTSYYDVGVQHLGLFEQLRSFEFIYMLICCSIGILRANLFIGMNPLLLDSYGDHEYHDDAYKQLFNYVLACGFVFIPVIGWYAPMAGMTYSLQLTNILGIAAFGMGLIPWLPVQVITFLVFTAFRAFLYSIVSSYNLNIFGKATFGKIQGLMFSIGAIINLLQEPLISWANSTDNGRMDRVCYTGMLMGIFTLAFTEIARFQGWLRFEPPQTPVGNVHRYTAEDRELSEPIRVPL